MNVCQLVSFSQCLFADLCVCLLSLCLCVNCVCLFVWLCLSFNVPVYHLMWLNHSICLCVTSCVCISIIVSMLHFVCLSVKSGCVYHSLWMSIPSCFLSVTLSVYHFVFPSVTDRVYLSATHNVCLSQFVCLSLLCLFVTQCVSLPLRVLHPISLSINHYVYNYLRLSVARCFFLSFI